MTAGGITAEPPTAEAPPTPVGAGRFSRYLTAGTFLAPALIVLAVWLVYPLVYTIVRSFFGRFGYFGTWVGTDIAWQRNAVVANRRRGSA